MIAVCLLSNKECLVIVRSPDQVEIWDRDSRCLKTIRLKIPDGVRIIACSSYQEDQIATLDTLDALRIHSLTSGEIVMESPGSSQEPRVTVEWDAKLIALQDSFWFKSDYEILDMTMDNFKHVNHSRRIHRSLTRISHQGREVFGSISCIDFTFTNNSIVVLEKNSLSLDFPASSKVVQLPENNEWSGVDSVGESLVVVGNRGVLLWRSGGSRMIEFPLPGSPTGGRRIHPGLSIVRKFSEVRTVPFLEESLLGLSLSQKESALVPTRSGRKIKFSSDFVILASNRVVRLDMKTEQWKLIGEWENVTNVVACHHDGGAWIICERKIIFCVDDRVLACNEASQDTTCLGLARIDEDLTLSLRECDMEFIFPHSSQSHLRFDSLTSDIWTNVIVIDKERFLLSSQGTTRVVCVSESSSTASIVSLESSNLPLVPVGSVPTTILSDVTENWVEANRIVSDVETMALIRSSDSSLYQITASNTVFCGGKHVFSSPANDWISAWAEAENGSLLILLGSGTIVDIKSRQSFDSGVVDGTSIAVHSTSGIVVGSFTGSLYLFDMQEKRLRCHYDSLSTYAIESVYFFLDGTRLAVSLRDGTVAFLSVNMFNIKVLRKISTGAVKMVPYTKTSFLVYSRTVSLVEGIEPFQVRSVDLGNSDPIACLSVELSEQDLYAIFPSNRRLVSFRIDSAIDDGARYVKPLPFRAKAMVTASDGPTTDMYILGSLEKINRSALFILLLERSKVGLFGLNDAVSVSGVLPFHEVREDPVSIALWNHEMFPGSGLLAVGTKGQVRGRLILFDRDSMHAIAKTSVPSSQIYCICPLSSSVLVIGCDDSVALVGLRPGPRTMPVVLFTVASLTTYTPVTHVRKIDANRFLVVMENGFVQLMKVTDHIQVEAVLESPTKIVSSCHVLPEVPHAFACSTADGYMNIYRVEPRTPAETGLMPLESSTLVGASIVASSIVDGKLVAALDNGTTIDITLRRRSIMQSS